MKHLSHKLSSLRLLMLLAALLGMGSSTAWADTKTETFESATSATVYNSTATVSEAKSSCGIGWSIYYGNVSTTSKISGSNSCLMRYYSSSSSNLGYAKTTTGIQGLSNVTFNAKVTNTGHKMGVWYSTDGSNWTAIATGVTLTTSSQSKSYDIPNSSPTTTYYIKIGITAATTDKKDLIIDDIVFTYNTTIAITSISGMVSSASIEVGGTTTLTPIVLPANTTETVTWESDNEAVATVSAGVVTGVGAGSTTIRAKSPSDASIKAECTVTVTAATTVATPTISLAEGTYNAEQSATLSCLTDGATIRYTTDGTDPTSSSSVYSSAISVDRSMTLKAKAFKDGLTDSEIASATYTLKCVAPEITIPSGVFVSSKVVTITAADGATIRYTTDGSTTPTTSEGTVYDAENKPSISATTTVKAIAYKTGWSDSDVQSTTFTKETVLDGMSALVAKTNTSDQSYYVNLTDAQVTYVNGKNGYMEDASAGIYIYNISPVLNKVYNGIFQVTYQLYNSMPELKSITAVEGTITDGVTKNPTEMTASDLSTYFADNLGRQIQITGHTTTTTTVLVTGINFYTTYYDPSFEKDHVYTIIGYPYNNNDTKQFRVVSAVEKPDAPTFDPAAGEFGADFELTINAATGSTIYYTTNGDTPTASSTEYNPESKPTISAGADVTVKAIAVLAGMTSTVSSASYEYKAVSQPTFDPADGTVLIYSETVTLTCDVDGAKIYYTTDGTTPTSSSSEYSDPIAITSDVTLKAIAKKGDDESSVATASYTVRAATPEISVVEGTYDAIQNVTLSCGTIGATIYYTTDGSTPTSSSTAYSSAITVSSTGTTIKAIAIKAGIADSEIASATYTLKAAAPTFSLAGGDFDETQSVELSCATEGAKIYYTINGSTPTASSTLYSSAISVSTITTIKAIAVKSGFTNSDVASQTYSVVIPTSLPFSYNSGYSSIAGTTGLTQSGIDKSDYVTTNTKLKFNDTGDYLILKFTGSPNVLSFNIKGNSFSGGTFKVQYSADGSSYTDLKSYTTLGDDSSESFNNIPVSARYIKWVYTSKSSGNVGLGNISLDECEVITVGSAGYTTHVTSHKVSMPASVTAYIATATGESTVTLSTIENVPASTAIVLKAAEGSYKLPVITTAADDASSNILLASDGTVTGDDENIFALGKKNGEVGFYLVDSSVTIPAGKAYLDLSGSFVKEFLSFDFGDADAIDDVRSKMDDVRGEIFNLAGQKINRLQKGINIVNGKKIIVK